MPALALVVACGGSQSEPDCREPRAGYKIAFVSERDGRPQIYVMNEDGSCQTRLTASKNADLEPVWSPDGSRIAFKSLRDGDWEIYVMNSDGSSQTRLTHSPAIEKNVAWSPDGSRILFVVQVREIVPFQENGLWELHVINADGTGQTRLTHSISSLEAAWSPDGSRIAFAGSPSIRDAYSLHAIWVISADGSGLYRVAWGASPAWSPDGGRIAFSLTGVDDNEDIYVINSNGSGPTRVTSHPGFDRWPVWSPDGRHIGFIHFPSTGGHEMHVINDDGSGETIVVSRLSFLGLAWSPDGGRIAFFGGTGEVSSPGPEIYVVNADGTGLTRLTKNKASDQDPAWSPAPNK